MYYRNTTLEYIVKADDIEDALGSAGGYTVTSAVQCCEENMEDCYRICVELDADDLKNLLGDPGKGVSFKEAEKRAKIQHEMDEKKYGSPTRAVGY